MSRWRRTNRVLCGLLLLGAGRGAVAEGSLERSAAGPSAGVEVTPLAMVRTALPGEVVTTVFRVTNHFDERRAFRSSVALPDGWKMVLTHATFTVEAGGSMNRLITFQVPRSAPAADYAVGLHVTDLSDSTLTDRGVITVRVGADLRLRMEVVEAPRFVTAGEPYEARYVVINEGNAAATVRLFTYSPHRLPVNLSTEVIRVGPGEWREFGARVQTDGLIIRRIAHRLTIKAGLDGLDPVAVIDQEVASATSVVDVIPSGRRNGPGAGRLPAVASVSLGGDRSRLGYQFGVAGEGALFEGRPNSLSFLFRAPDLRRAVAAGPEETFRVAYEDSLVSIRVGDHVFRRTILTETGRFGTGASARVRFDHATFGGHAAARRNSIQSDRSASLFAEWQVRPALAVGAHGVRSIGFFDASLVSTTLDFSPDRGPGARVELATDALGTGDPGSSAHAVLFDRGDGWSYGASVLAAGRKFDGPHRGTFTASGSGRLRLNEQVSVDQGVRRTRRSFYFGTQPVAEQTEFVYRGGATFSGGDVLPWRASAHVLAQTLGRNVESVRDLRSLVGAEVGLATHRGRFGASMRAGLGRTAGAPEPDHSPYTRLTLSARYRFGRHVVNLAAESFRGRTVFRPLEQDLWSANMGVVLRSVSRFRVSMYVSGALDRENDVHRYMSAYSVATYQTGLGHVLGLEGRISTTAARGAGTLTEGTITYSVPIGLPSVPQAGSRISGRVYDAATGEPLADALLRFGAATRVTNRDGRFTFARPASGVSYLLIDRLSIGLDRVPLVPMPMEVGANGTENGPINIAVAHSAKVTGELVIFNYPSLGQNRTPVREHGIRQAVVELEDAFGRLRRITDRDGRFEFVDLRPGEWRLRVVYSRAPETHFVELEEYIIRLEPGSEHEQLVRVLPIERRIKMKAIQQNGSDSGTVQVNRPPAVDAGARGPDRCLIRKAPDGQHVVARGETLASLARRYYCDTLLWPRIWIRNRAVAPDPHRLEPGTRLFIPDLVGAPIDHSELRGRNPLRVITPPGAHHRVAPGETLVSIARLYFGDSDIWPRIWLANRDRVPNPTLLLPGTVLELPSPEKLAPVERSYLEPAR